MAEDSPSRVQSEAESTEQGNDDAASEGQCCIKNIYVLCGFVSSWYGKKLCSVPFPFVLVWLGFAWFLALSVCLSRGFRFVCLLCLMEYVVSSFRCCSMMALRYWAVQAGLLTPLTFARHRLSPLAAFTSGAYFLHTGRR